MDLEVRSSDEPLQLSYCYLDDDPVAVAERIVPALEQRWAEHGLEPLLAAPFHPVQGYDYDRFLP